MNFFGRSLRSRELKKSSLQTLLASYSFIMITSIQIESSNLMFTSTTHWIIKLKQLTPSTLTKSKRFMKISVISSITLKSCNNKCVLYLCEFICCLNCSIYILLTRKKLTSDTKINIGFIKYYYNDLPLLIFVWKPIMYRTESRIKFALL